MSEMEQENTPHANRRQVIVGAALLGAGAAVGGGLVTGCSSDDDKGNSGKLTERQQTLYIGGWQSNPPTNFNPCSTTATFPTRTNQMQLIYESLFQYDLRDGGMKPGLGASFTQDAQSITVKIQPDAKWHDGKPVTADDVVYTWDFGNRVTSLDWHADWVYLKGVTKVDEKTVKFELNPAKLNPLVIKASMCSTWVLPKHVWSEVEKTNTGVKLAEYMNEKPMGSGPYKLDSYNAQQVILVRYDDYWGKSVRGKLPAPKKIVHPIWTENSAYAAAFEKNEIDAMQVFVQKIWEMWEVKKLPVKTWYQKQPYHMPGSMPFLTFNTKKKGLDNPKVRRAIAFAIDYARIAEQAVSKTSDPAQSSLLLPLGGDQQYFDKANVEANGWKYDPAKAKEILEKDLGATKGSDGIYKLSDGTRLGKWKLQTPKGWSDWNASCQVVAENLKAIGIDVEIDFPEANDLTPKIRSGDYEMAMWYINAKSDPSTPWGRFRDVMDMRGAAPIGETTNQNWGRFEHPQVPELLDKAAVATGDQAKATFKELDTIFMQNAPMIPLVYRALDFFEVNESVWTGFPTEKNPTAAPTWIGAGVQWLYEITPKKK